MRLTTYQVSTLIALAMTLAAIVVLATMGEHLTAEVIGAFGALLLAILPSMLPRVSVAAARASMRPPPLPADERDDL